MENSIKAKENISIFIIAIILFTNLAIANAKYIVYVYIVAFISLLYAMYIIIKKPKIINYLISSYSFYWILFFSILMFIYGYFGENQSEYSVQFHLLNVYWIYIILIILHDLSDKIINIISKASAVTIVFLTGFILATNSLNIADIFSNNGNIIGYTAVGNQNTTAISYIFLTIPVLYEFIVEKNKKYSLITLLSIFFMLITGSKKSIISLLIMIIIIGLGKSTNTKKLIKNIFLIFIVLGLIIGMCYYLPFFHTIIWERVESMIASLTNVDLNSQSSTGLRINFIITAFTKGWDKPFFGHGWGSFAPMYGYSPLYKVYMYTHNNYAEIFFSFGLIGLLMYYWFPIKNILDTRYIKDNNKKILCKLFIAILLFIDFSSVCCYASILPYIGFSIVSFIARKTKILNIKRI